MQRTKTEYSREGLIMARDYERCCATLCHHVSNDSYYGTPFLLAEFQRENIWKPMFACGDMRDGKFERKFKRFIFGLPSGAGKTELAAAIVLTVATMEVIHNGQYGVVASSKDQVRNLYEKIATMIKLSDMLRAQWEISKDVMTHKETGAKIMVLPNKADALESWHFNVLIFDELHVYRDDGVWAAGLKGQKVLSNPLSIGITTAGDGREGFLWETLKKTDADPAMYCYWLGLDDDADITKKESWKDILQVPWITWEQIEDQRNSASSKRAFERYTANRFPRKRKDYSCFSATELEACSKDENTIIWEQPWTLGIDGATSGDSFAIVAYQKRNEDGQIIEATAEWIFDEPDEETGYYPMSDIMELIANLYQTKYPSVVGIDPNRMIIMSNQLSDAYGIDVVAFAQNNATMCQAASLIINAVHSKSLRLKGCDKLKSHMANCIEDDKSAFGVRFGKDNSKSKIDGAIALSIAALAFEKLVGSVEYQPFN